MHRFFCQPITARTHTVSITDKKEIHHIKDVLRLKTGDKAAVFDGQGTHATGILRKVKSTEITIAIDNVAKEVPKQSAVILACAIPKKSKFETIIEKCTELGVDEIIPLKTQRTEVSILDDKRAQKMTRYQTVAVNAAKQSRRNTIPKIHPIANFSDALKTVSNEHIALISCMSGQRNNIVEILQKTTPKPKKIIFFIGPEGDFTGQEISLAIEAGCVPVALGDTVLKVETAAIVVCALSRFYSRDEK